MQISTDCCPSRLSSNLYPQEKKEKHKKEKKDKKEKKEKKVC